MKSADPDTRAGESPAQADASPPAGTALDDVLSNLSHRLRTPLHIINGYVQAAEESLIEKIDPQERVMFEQIAHGSGQLIRTVEEVMRYSRLVMGGAAAAPADIRLDTLLATAVDLVRPKAEAKGLRVICDGLSQPVTILGDAGQIAVAVDRILDNAVKYTGDGAVAVRLIVNGRVRVEISDTGIGMTEEYLPRAFDAFSQGDTDINAKQDGIGLGLATAKRCLELNGASVSAHSRPGEGSIFTITFPSAAPRGMAAEADDARPLILVVEDHPATAEFMRFILGRRYDVETAGDADEARAILAQRRVRAICMDVTLRDEISGLDFTRELRADDATRALPIIAVTAHAFETDRRACLDAGCDDVLVKPFNNGVLFTMLDALLARQR